MDIDKKASVPCGSVPGQPAAEVNHGSSPGSQSKSTACDEGGSDPLKMANPWYVDLSKCNACGVKFTIFNHRHMCRVCGNPVCHSCSRSRKVVRAYQAPKRVCDECVDQFWTRKTTPESIKPSEAADETEDTAPVSLNLAALEMCPGPLPSLPLISPSTPMLEGEFFGSTDPSKARPPHVDMTATTRLVSPRALASMPEDDAVGPAVDEGTSRMDDRKGDLSPSGAETAAAAAAETEGMSGDAGLSSTPVVPEESQSSEPLVVSTDDAQGVEAPSMPKHEEASVALPCTDESYGTVKEVEASQDVVESTELDSGDPTPSGTETSAAGTAKADVSQDADRPGMTTITDESQPSNAGAVEAPSVPDHDEASTAPSCTSDHDDDVLEEVEAAQAVGDKTELVFEDANPSGAEAAPAEADETEVSGDAGPSLTHAIFEESQPSEPLMISTDDDKEIEATPVPEHAEASVVPSSTDERDGTVVKEMEVAQTMVERTELISGDPIPSEVQTTAAETVKTRDVSEDDGPCGVTAITDESRPSDARAVECPSEPEQGEEAAVPQSTDVLDETVVEEVEAAQTVAVRTEQDSGDLCPSGAEAADARTAETEVSEDAVHSGMAAISDESRPSEALVVSTDDAHEVEDLSPPKHEEGSTVLPCADDRGDAVVNEVTSAQAAVEETELDPKAARTNVCTLPCIDAEGRNNGAGVPVTEEVRTHGAVDTTRVLGSSGVIQTGEVCENRAQAGNKCQEILDYERDVKAFSVLPHLKELNQAGGTAEHELMESVQTVNNSREHSVTGAGEAGDMLRARAGMTSAAAQESQTKLIPVCNTLSFVAGFGLGVAVSCVAWIIITVE